MEENKKEVVETAVALEERENEESKVAVELIKPEKNNNNIRNKILIFVILAIVVVVGSSIAGIMIASKAYESKIAVQEETEEPTPEPTPTPKIPIYSDEAKERIKNIYVSNDEEKVAYLTFDDGPSSSITPQILEILRNENIKATFFVLGSRVDLYPEIVKQEYDEGHYIANHGDSHNYKSIYSSTQAVLDEYNKTEEKIKSALGNENYSSHLFRFPGGSEGGKYKIIKNDAKGLLEENNIAYINWNCLTNDSVGKPTYESLIKDFKLTQNRKK